MKRSNAIANALRTLLDASWPSPDATEELAKLGAAESEDTFRAAARRLFLKVQVRFPDTHFWIKNEQSHFLFGCPNFVAASTLDAGTLFSGINDVDPRIPWTRQGVLYIRDDKEVLRSGAPKLNIVERQDRDGRTVWLRTSKVPFRSDGGDGTVGGFDIISAQDAWRISRESRES